MLSVLTARRTLGRSLVGLVLGAAAGSEHTEEVQLEGTGEGLIDSSILENGNCCAVGS